MTPVLMITCPDPVLVATVFGLDSRPDYSTQDSSADCQTSVSAAVAVTAIAITAITSVCAVTSVRAIASVCTISGLHFDNVIRDAYAIVSDGGRSPDLSFGLADWRQ